MPLDNQVTKDHISIPDNKQDTSLMYVTMCGQNHTQIQIAFIYDLQLTWNKQVPFHMV